MANDVCVSAASPETRPSLLVRLADAGDTDAWSIFHRCYGPLIHEHCLRRGLQHADAAEVTQEVMLRVLSAIPKFDYDPTKGRFRAWLGTLTYRQLCRFWRRRARLPTTDPQDLDWPEYRQRWDADVDAFLLRESLARTRRRVRPEAWDVFVAAWLRDEPADEIARRYGEATEWVYVTKSRVLKQLRREVVLLMEDLALEP